MVSALNGCKHVEWWPRFNGGASNEGKDDKSRKIIDGDARQLV